MTIESDVAQVMASYDDGMMTKGEAVDRLTDLLTATNVAEVVAAVPEDWRTPLVHHLRALSEEGPLIRIFGGTYSYEREGDPVRRAEMKAEVDAWHAARDAHFEEVVRPAIVAWVGAQR